MKNIIKIFRKKLAVSSVFVVSMLTSVCLYAQDAPDVKVNGQDVGSLFSRYWMWIAGVIVLLLLILLFGRSSRTKRTTTTVTRDNFGDVSSSRTTTEVDTD